MTRLPWQHTRSRTKSGNEKTSLTKPQDWFSKTNAEPSRQALTDLVKAHNRVKSDESYTVRSRPRTSTITSVLSQRGESRAGSLEDEGWSRPSSRSTREDSIHSSLERSGTPTKTLVSKGSQLLKRTSSRISLASAASSSSLHALASPPRSRASNSTIRNDDLRSKISMPFDFQHITHTEETHFTALRRIDESTLADQYRAVTTTQDVAPTLRGIAASDLQASSSTGQHHAMSSDIAVLPGTSVQQQLPQTPPRPQPPPKDDKVFDVGRAIAYDNPADDSHGKQSLESAQTALLTTNAHLAEDNEAELTTLDSKPLPELPVIHAITTEDDSARAMISGPLPSPPFPVMPLSDSDLSSAALQQRQQSSTNLRGTSFYPSTKSSMPNLLAASHLLAAPKALPRHHSDMALSKQARNVSATASTRTSMSFAAIDTRNWEEAVDEAWDVAEDDEEESSLHSLCTTKISVEPQHLDMSTAESACSTPLMMAGTSNMTPRTPERVSFAHGLEVHQLESVKEDEPSTDLTGLGISPCPASGTTSSVPRLSRSSSIHFPKRRSSLSYTGNDVLTRSSSQESIIKSIASSIVGTHRSSNSSVSAVDLSSAYPGEDDDLCSNRVRPESGCLPPDILEQISQFGTTFADGQLPASEDVPPVPALPAGSYRKSAPKMSVPERSSSIVATNPSGSFRKRSSTWGSRSRQGTQSSYSLFPNAQSPAYTTVTSS